MTDQSFIDSMMEMFVFETTQMIEKLEIIILTNEKTSCYPDDEISEIFRIMHTIKGSSAMMMFDNISALAHSMEDLFYYLREEKPVGINYSILSDIIFACLDFLKVELEKITDGSTPDGEYSALKSRIDQYLQKIKQNDTELELEEDSTDTTIVTYTEMISNPINLYKAIIFFDEGISMENIHAYSLIHSLKKSQNEVLYIPEDIDTNEGSADIIRKDGFQIYIKSQYSYELIQQLLVQTVFVKKIDLIQLENDEEIKKRFTVTQCVEEEMKKSDTGHRDGGTFEEKEHLPISSQPSIISVNVMKLDQLMDLVGEIVIAEAMVLQNPDLNGLVLNNFNKASRQLKKITDEIQDIVMAIRLVPLAATFHKMQRLVRDMGKKLDKEVKLELIGEDTEVDKNIIEHISDPLMHLVRNSMDHGIETLEEREQKGKPRIGTITLEAKSSGSDVLIIIKDDGRGLDCERILKKARENNLLIRPEADMTEKEIYNLILLPGFSTNEEVTEFSGRGVGMDVVLKNIEMVGGSVVINSVQGKGTVFMLKIPLTLAIIDGMNIKVGNSHYTIPTVSVKEFFRTDIEDIITDPDGNEMIMVRGQCYPVIRLYELFGVKGAQTEINCGIIIMIEQDGRTLCIFADELLGQQQVVVKTLPEYIRKLRKINGLVGCTLLGNGYISLILDVAGIIMKTGGC